MHMAATFLQVTRGPTGIAPLTLTQGLSLAGMASSLSPSPLPPTLLLIYMNLII